MKKYLFFILALTIGVMPISAQFKVKTEKMDASKKYGQTKPNRSAACLQEDNGKEITYTPQYYATKAAMLLPGSFISFQKIENQKYIYINYVLFDANEHNNSIIKSLTFLFKDGTKLVLPTAYNFTAILYPQVNRADHSARATCTDEQMDMFSKKQLISIGIDFTSPAKSFNAETPEKKSYEVAMRAAFFLRGEKLKEVDLQKAFQENESKSIQDAKWDF